MAFERHPAYSPAPTAESRLWRYMSLPKYLSLLQRNELFFSGLELMARTDPFEGSLAPSRFIHRQWSSLDDVPEEILQKLPGYLRAGESGLETALQRYIGAAEHRIRQTYAYRRSYFVNCWHLSEHESSAMWDIYSRRNEGIAVVSCESRIEAALSGYAESIYGGRVTYGDYSAEKFVIDEGNAFTPILHKRLSFAYEAEYRLVYWDTSVTHKQIRSHDGVFNWNGKLFPDTDGSRVTTVPREVEEIERLEPCLGHYVACDLNELVGAVYISPLAENWFLDVVQRASELSGLQAQIVRSSLLAEPLR
jgi:hypothetical protein